MNIFIFYVHNICCSHLPVLLQQLSTVLTSTYIWLSTILNLYRYCIIVYYIFVKIKIRWNQYIFSTNVVHIKKRSVHSLFLIYSFSRSLWRMWSLWLVNSRSVFSERVLSMQKIMERWGGYTLWELLDENKLW